MSCMCPICNGHSRIIYNKCRENIPVLYMMCEKCGIVFQDQNKKKKLDLQKYYSNEFRESMELSKMEEYYKLRVKQGEKIYRNCYKSMDWLVKIRNTICSRKVLDVGCGCGGVMEPFRRMGFYTMGVDIKSAYTTFGKNQRGAEIYEGFLEDFVKESPLEKFDLIYLSHVLEHFTNPMESVIQLKKILKDNGRIYIEVPNFERPYAWRELQFFFMYGHEFYYTPLNLNYMMSLCGFRNISFDDNYGPFMYGIYKKDNNVNITITEGYAEKLLKLFNQKKIDDGIKIGE